MKEGISASMICVDFLNLKEEIELMEQAKIDYLHFDIMDGNFVSNYALGVCLIDQVRQATKIPLDIHLMIERPEMKLHYFGLQPGDSVSVHYETTPHIQRILSNLKQEGIYTGVALNPATPIDVLEFVCDVIDFVLIMTVNPGFAGQALVPATLKKVEKTRQFLNANNAEHVVIQVDGNINFENARKLKAAGAGNFVAGSSGLFRKDMSLVEAATKLRAAIM
jgi:ribulose-phosphate 3-epimerase